MTAYLGTNDLIRVEKLIRQGDEYAALVWTAWPIRSPRNKAP
jgi:butyrate kinase